MSLEAYMQNNSVLFLVVYHINKHVHFGHSLQEFYNKALVGYNYILITGDLSADPSIPYGKLLLGFVDDNGLTKHTN